MLGGALPDGSRSAVCRLRCRLGPFSAVPFLCRGPPRAWGLWFRAVDFFDSYYTGDRVPSWEDNENHARGVELLGSGYQFAKKHVLGGEPMHQIRRMEPRFAFDNDGLVRTSWRGFSWFGPYDVKYASNGVHGVGVVDRLLHRFNTKDALGVLMTDSVFSAHLTYTASDASFHLDLSSLEKYAPLPGYAKLGGGARFSFAGGRLKTEEVHFGGKSYTPSEDNHDQANRAFRQNRLEGWRYAEKAVIASLLSMTNLEE
ncbi:unnamed protein product [Prorocentrum cordatum]|uniref:Uncharacterized protein n=1 Tax=Prorocentrum cordatum TaxID=2364126 RepID=A0ABN9QEH4_9DINO|nr:unnamed protein product [Polarella glacialis]